MSTNRKSAPAKAHFDGSTFIKVWRNAAQDGSPRYTSTVGYIYTDKESGEVRESRNLRDDDLLRLPSLTPRARNTIRQLKKTDRDQSQQQSDEQSRISDGREEFRQSRQQTAQSQQQNLDRQP